MELTMKENELVYLGASIAAGCKPCTSYHLGKAKEAGASEEEIVDVITVSGKTRDGAKKEMVKHATNFLGQSNEHHVAENNVNPARINILISIGAAFAANCTSTLNKYIALGESVGITNKDLNKIFKAARFVKMKAASHVDKIALRFEEAKANERDSDKSDGCGYEKSENDVQTKSNNSEVKIGNSCC